MLMYVFYFSGIETSLNPCVPSPCGPNSICKVNNEQPVCSCTPNYHGAPPNCRPECVISAECPTNKACENQKCIDPCIGQCGRNAACHVINHSPICSCMERYTGDPFNRCYPVINVAVVAEPQKNPCLPSPCGPFSECRDIGNIPSCTCLPNYIGAPPACRPECTINSDCPSYLSCINQKCRDPCPGSCGLNAQCTVNKNTPICSCIENYVGDAFTECKPQGNKKNCITKFRDFIREVSILI